MDMHSLHLMVNHFPVILSLLGFAAAVFAIITRRRGVLLFTLATLTLSGASAAPAFFSGKEAEEVVEDRWYVDRAQLEEHEEAGEAGMLMLIFTGIVAAAAWWMTLRTLREARTGMGLLVVLLVLSALSATAMARTSWLGGFIAIKNPVLVDSPPPPGFVRPPSR
jgi:formate hydrogenlyase subunit 3/multisubunit Na+/H+ antiporter MnhD subunit